MPDERNPSRLESLLEHAGWLRRLAGALVGEAALADDLVQETWMAALRHPPAASESPRPWLSRVLRNLAFNRRRANRRRAEHESRWAVPGSPSGPEAVAHEAEMQRLLAAAVAQLDEPMRAVVVLRYYRGKSSGEIGRELGIPASSVRWRLQRAMDELRTGLDRSHEGGRSTWLAAFTALRPTAESALAAPLGLTPIWGTVAAALVVVFALTRFGPSSGERAGWLDPLSPSSFPRAAVVLSEPLPAASTVAQEPEREPVSLAPEVAPVRVSTTEMHGQVLIDGQPPVWPVQLVLRQWNEDPDAAPGTRDSVLSTDDQGTFTLGGLEPSWRALLFAPRYRQSGEVRLEPEPEVVVEFESFGYLTGRVLNERLEPAAWARGAYLWENERTFESHQSEFQADGSGRFRVPIRALAGQEIRARLVIESAIHGRVTVTVPSFRSDEGLELGDLLLEPVCALSFQVRDELGRPLDGAVARLDAESLSGVSNPTNFEGRGELRHAPQRAVVVRFSALRHADEVRLVEPGEVPVVFLRPVASLDLVVRASSRWEGHPPGVVLVAHEIPFPSATTALPGGPDWDQDWIQEALGATPAGIYQSISADEKLYEAFFQPDLSGFVRLTGVVPEVPFDLFLDLPEGRRLAAQGIVLSPGQWRVLELPFTP